MYRVLAFIFFAAGCSPATTHPDPAPIRSTTTDSAPATTSLATTSTVAITTTTLHVDEGEPMSEQFTVEIEPVTREDLGVSWREGCPVDVADLRRMLVSHYDLSGATTQGELIVHHSTVEDLSAVFERLFDAAFPIESMRPIAAFDGDDDASMAANNSSAFNCRVVDGTSRWSEHAYGTAVDINPVINPWVRAGQVDPPAGADYLDRTADVPGLIAADGVVVAAFADVGWGWGGGWTNSLDYQHFSAAGR